MTTTDVQFPQLPPQNSPSSAKLELLSKLVAGAAVLFYASGFLVTSIYHAQFGLIQTNPFRPRILSAGVWFILLTAIPISTVIIAYGKDRMTWERLARYLYPYWITCTVLSVFPAILFNFSDVTSIQIKWGRIVALLICTAIFTAPILKRMPKIGTALSVFFTTFFLLWVIRDLSLDQKLGYGSITLWFFFIGMMTMVELMNREQPMLDGVRWIMAFFLGLAILWMFARDFYPNIKASWGGGAPIPVTVYFTKESTVRPGRSANALLIDETDAGLYVIGENENTAIFIPRTAVSILYFSDNINNSNLLKDVQASPPASPADSKSNPAPHQ
jgi:hypothetical protein